MEHKKLNRIIAFAVFFVSLFILALTTQSSVPFWDCAESTASAYLLQVPHPPGAPFQAILGRIFLMFPFFEVAFRMNFMSAIAGALTIMVAYLTSVILITLWRGLPKTIIDKLIVYGSSVIGALAFSFSDSFWFNAVESEVFALSLFMLALIVWLALHWYVVSDTEARGEKYFILIAYLFGLSVGVHQLSLLAFFTVALIYYFKKYEFTLKSFGLFWVICAAGFIFIYKGLITGIPILMGSSGSRFIFALLGIGLLFGIYYSYKNDKGIINLALLSVLFIILGYSTYTMIVIRANKGLALNQNNPDSFEKLSPYLGREQYGDYPFINFDKKKYGGKLFPRRWTEEPHRVERFKNYKSDWDYFVKYQFYNMWLRYLLWNYVGRAGDVQDAPSAWFSKTDDKWIIGKQSSFPNKYYAIPLLLGLIGAVYHFWKDKKFGFSIWVLFVITGFGLMIYQNMQDPQPRERDYFFIGSFYVFAIWIALGIAGILESIEKSAIKLKNHSAIYAGAIAVLFVAVPVNMLIQNYDDHNRKGNYLAWDFAYNILQSCPKDAILFTAGDNDTFPVWYMQDVEGIRRDVRLVNLSLVNTSWYALQMKNETPYSANKVPISYSDAELSQMEGKFYEWEKNKVIRLPVSKEVYKNFLNEELNISSEFKSLLKFSPDNYNDTSKYPNEITFNVKSSYSIPDNRGRIHYGLRMQDAILLDIIKTNNWQRPVCFAMTFGPDHRIGLDSYLRLDGMAYRLTPFPLNSRNEFVNSKIMYENLTKEPDGFATEPALGFKFRNLNDPGLYLDENAMHTAQNYRQMFLSLAAYLINFTKDTVKTTEILSQMEKKIAPSTVRLDYIMKYDLISFYRAVNQEDKVRKLASEIETECLLEINKNPLNVSGPINPYKVLIDIYETLPDYDKEIDLLNKLAQKLPQDNTLKNKIEQVKGFKNQYSKLSKIDTTKKER